MGLRFFADHCVPASVTRTLRENGHTVLVLRDHLPQNAPDQLVIEKAQLENAILLTLNGDFSDIVAYPPSEFLGIVAFQLKNQPVLIQAVMTRFLAFLQTHNNMSDFVGCLFLVEPHRIRIRR